MYTNWFSKLLDFLYYKLPNVKFINSKKCKHGWHCWTYMLSGGMLITSEIPDTAKCKHCKLTYKDFKDKQ